MRELSGNNFDDNSMDGSRRTERETSSELDPLFRITGQAPCGSVRGGV